MILCGEARDIEAMREAQPKPGYRRLKDIIEARMSSLVKRVKEFLPEGEVVKTTTMVSNIDILDFRASRLLQRS
jgi:hypothetical protein